MGGTIYRKTKPSQRISQNLMRLFVLSWVLPIIERTGNVAAVQRQLGHRNAIYSMQYARITAEELGAVLEER